MDNNLSATDSSPRTADAAKMQKAIDRMCLECAGETIENGGTCWDKKCPLALFTKYSYKARK